MWKVGARRRGGGGVWGGGGIMGGLAVSRGKIKAECGSAASSP